MRKGAIKGVFGLFVFVVLLIAISSFVLAEDNADTNMQTAADKGYQCLNNEINNKTSLTLEQAIFASLAIGSKQLADDKIDSEKSSAFECWPKASCRLKETAQVALALKRRGVDTSEIEDWLISKNATPSELTWYLEIDASDHVPTKCTIRYGRTGSVEIRSDMTLTKNTADDCFTISSSGYWLKINPSCLTKEFEIKCNNDFITSLLYEKRAGGTIFVSSESHVSVGNASTIESVKARCFKTGNLCDYEGTLWAAFVLNKAGKDVSAFIPYLSALAEDNLKYFPSAFLFSVMGSSVNNEFYTDIIQKQNKNNIWDITGSPYKKYYDTSLALLALSNSGANEFELARTSLFGTQMKNGCWSERDSIIDTSFLLYSGWQRAVSSGGGSGGTAFPRCASVNGQSCENRVDCIGADGMEMANFECTGGSICCSVTVPKKTCAELSGNKCTDNEICSGESGIAFDGTCCLADCTEEIVEQTNTCLASEGSCKIACSTNEDQDDSKSCGNGAELCCLAKTTGGISWIWIIILIILIIVIILAIIYRDKLRVWWFRFRGKGSVSPVMKPGVPPLSGGSKFDNEFKPSPKFAPSTNPFMRPMARRPASPRDKELEDTLKKLKDMSK